MVGREAHKGFVSSRVSSMNKNNKENFIDAEFTLLFLKTKLILHDVKDP